MKVHYFFSITYMHKHNYMPFLRLKGLRGAQRRKGCTKQRKSLEQNRYKRMNYFKTITKTITSEKILLVQLDFFVWLVFWTFLLGFLVFLCGFWDYFVLFSLFNIYFPVMF